VAVLARVRFDIAGTTRYPTADGRLLEVSGETLDGELALRFEFRDPEKMLPRDALACDFRVADREGRVWQTTSRFTTKLFVVHMYDFSSLRHMNLFTAKKAEEQWVKAFENGPVLEDARFGTDDRFYRTLLVNRKQVEVKFKYTVLHFDVAVNQYPEGSYLTDLAIRICRGSFWDEGSTLPEMGFYLSCEHLLRSNTGVLNPERNFWVDAPIPMPLVFAPTGGAATAQPGVRVVG
jgi:hypothetical protein